MKRMAPAIGVLGILLAAALYWGAPDRAPRPATPAPARSPAPEPAITRTTYHLPPPEHLAVPEPEPDPDPVPDIQPRLPREVMNALTAASNDATGLMWEECMRPWRDEHEVDDEPLTINLIVTDGRVSDIELISPWVLPTELVECMKDQAWTVEFPEHAEHRGEVRLQRTPSLRR